jgi:hypothetical protein
MPPNGLEPIAPERAWILNPLCLPISPRRLPLRDKERGVKENPLRKRGENKGSKPKRAKENP